MFVKIKPVHFIGIGGAGMYPLAEVLFNNGYTVTGSDVEESQASIRLKKIGIPVQIAHSPEHVKNAGLVIYTAAIGDYNAELVYARENNIRAIKRADALGDLMKSRFSIGVAGTHGKTTTTAITGTVIRDAGFDPTVIVGGTMVQNNSNAIIGKGDMLITEADEFDRSFLKMQPAIAIITNIEEDHLNIYKDITDLKDSFKKFIEKVPFYGVVIACYDDKNVMEVVGSSAVNFVTYGLNEGADYRVTNVIQDGMNSSFDLGKSDNNLGRITINMNGIHNILNSVASVIAALEIGIGFDIICSSLKRFKGIKRRFEYIGIESGVTVINDYAHHPTEIQTTIDAAKTMGFNRIVALFQPHLFSRTEDFLNEFAEVLTKTDISFVAPIYKAREKYTDTVSGNDICKKMKELGFENGQYIPTMDEISSTVASKLLYGDLLLVLGAGDIWEKAVTILKELSNG